ncbi:unnamed protein product [Microthlaspi erraticum]|uniref:F-box domain-containing protein n=1 Tax=Microthlaspi erraticum TaxID=1685480 RepID=A0A6D2I7S2_9BRAS|nr:unnamed protein product [Microthlaspi erraticum]
MDGKGKASQARSKGLSSTLKEDRLSQLPDALICQILYHLYTKESVKTSVLSKRWRHLWLWVPSLELWSFNFTDSNSFVSFGDRIFDFSRASCIHKLSLSVFAETEDRLYSVKDVSFLTSWLDAATKRKIQHLDLHLSEKFHFYMKPLKFYQCETLVCLRLFDVALDDASAHFVSFPCLKTMRLDRVLCPNESTFEKLVSSCPVLEELEVDDLLGDANVFRVRSQSLKRFTLVRDYSYLSNPAVPGVVVDAPLLSRLSINDLASESFIVNNLAPKARLDITITFGSVDVDEFSKTSGIRSFLLGISKVGDMTLCADTFELLCEFLELEPLPQFGYMSRLYIGLRVSYLKWLPTFLEICPNLKSLILMWECSYEEMEQVSFTSVPECLISSLEFVDIQVPILGHAAEMKLVRYLLKNSAVLKKLTLRLSDLSTREKSLRRRLQRIPRASTKCEVVVL